MPGSSSVPKRSKSGCPLAALFHGLKSRYTTGMRERSRLTTSGSHSYPLSTLQADEQPSPEEVLPSSHSCPARRSASSKIPSPQAVRHSPPAPGQVGTLLQNGVQPSVMLWFLPSSHGS